MPKPNQASVNKAHELAPKLIQYTNEELSVGKIAKSIGISRNTTLKYLKILGLPTRSVSIARKEPTPRSLEMLELRKKGETLEAIGKKFNITRERVRQIIVERHPEEFVKRHAAKQKKCAHCYTDIRSDGTYCGTICKRLHRNEAFFNRDLAVKIIVLRDAGKGWGFIADAVESGMTHASFRSAMQRWKSVIFTSVEEDHYFPKWKDNRFTTPNGELCHND